MPQSSLYDSMASFLGKEEHLARVTTDLYNMRHAIIQSHEIVLIDDDVENVEVARRFGHFAFEVKSNVTISDIVKFSESLYRQEIPAAYCVKDTDANHAAGFVASPCTGVQNQIEQRRAVSAYVVNSANQELSDNSMQVQRTHSIHFVLVNGTYRAI